MTSTDLIRFIRRFRQLSPEQQVAVDRLVQSLSKAGKLNSPPDEFVALGYSSLREVWDNDEDAEYDQL